MKVIKRNGQLEEVHFDKITERLRLLSKDLAIEPINVARMVCSQIVNNIKTSELDILSANVCASLCVQEPDYEILGSRLLITNHEKETDFDFVTVVRQLQNNKDILDDPSPILDTDFVKFIEENSNKISEHFSSCVSETSLYQMSMFGWKTLCRSYLMKSNNKIVERPEHLFYRVALFLHYPNLEKTQESYRHLAQGNFIHATPTLFHAGTKRAQMSSCFDKDTLVNTLNGPVRICDIEIGDEVVTHNGNVKPVVQIHKNKINGRDLYEVSITKTNKFIVTQDHKLYVFNQQTKKKGWKQVNDLTTNDYVMIPNYKGKVIMEDEINVMDVLKNYNFSKYERTNKQFVIRNVDNKVCIETCTQHSNFVNQDAVNCVFKSTSINNIIKVDNDFCRFLGIWYGDGHIIKSKKMIRGIGITIHKENKNLIDFCINMKKHFSIEHVTNHDMIGQNVTQILFNSPILGMLFETLFGCGFNCKKLFSNFYQYSDDLIYSLLSGLVTTDGCISTEGTISLCMANKEFIDSIYSLCRLHNMDVGKVCKSSINKFTKTQAYHISLTNLRYNLTDIWKIYKDDRISKISKKSHIRNQSSPIIDDGFKYLRFLKKDKVNIEDEHVYTLGIQDDHSYSIEGIIAQNCFLLGTEDNVDGIYKTITDVAKISKWAGGIGVHISNIRAKNSYIRGTNGQSNGIMPMLRVYNDTSRYIDQCVHAETKVYTKNGVKPIYMLEPGKDEILQKQGHFEVLEKQLEHVYKGEILQIYFENGTNILITPEHPVLGSDECWIDAIDLRKEDKILFPVPKYTKDVESYSEMLMTCWGLFMGWGTMTLHSSSVKMNFPLQMDPKYKELFQFMLSSNMIQYQDYLFTDGYQVRFDRTHLSPFRYSLLYNSNGNKQIHSSILHLPLNKLHKFVNGLLTSFTFHSDFDQKFYHLNLEEFDDLTIDNLFYIFSRFGISVKYQDQILTIPKKDMNEIPGNFIENTIKDIKKDYFDGVLYDLEFQKEHSYVITSSILHNGGGKRKGSFAIYIEPWHGDIYDFVMAKRNVGNEDERARDLFYGLWIPDLFMKRVEEDGIWSLMCPDRCKGLNECYGKEFETLYESYESQQKYIRQIKARDLWKEILNSQIETGLPYMLYKDSCNMKSNQKNLGTIKSSNLCCEIIQYSDSKNYSVCNLASINLSNCVKEKPITFTNIKIYTKKWCVYCTLIKKRLERKGIQFTSIDAEDNPIEFENLFNRYPLQQKTVPKICIDKNEPIGFWDFCHKYLKPEFDFEELQKRVEVLVVNMNKVIDKNYYPTEETKRSNVKNRPIGLGVQGLADLFCKLYINFDSEEARYLNRKIFETMYYTALKTSNKYCIDNKLCYPSFQGSPLSKGLFHFDMCPNFDKNVLEEFPKYDWESLRQNIQKNGVSNSLFLAPMPTASTSQILNQNECIEPYTSNLYVRRTLAGEFTMTNKYMTQDLRDVGFLDKNIIDHLIINKGSIQKYIKLPKTIRDIYRTSWEIPQKSLIDMAAERQWFIDQSQSFNLFVAEPTLDKLTKMHFYGWKKGLKTGSYYIRTKPQHFSQNFTVDPSKEKEEEEEECLVCSA